MELRRQRREPSVDLFALAVIIFQLLFDGWHPFAAAGDPDLAGRIRRAAFPHVAGSPDRPPPAAPLFAAPGRASAPFHPGIRGQPLGPGGPPHGRRRREALKRNAKALARLPAAGRHQGPDRRGAALCVRRGVAAVAAVAVVATTLGFLRGAVAPRRGPAPGVREPHEVGPGKCR